MDVYLISRMPHHAVAGFVANVSSLRRWLGTHYTVRVVDSVARGALATVVSLARNEHNPSPELYAKDDRLLYVFSGYLVDDFDASHAAALVARGNGDARPVTRSPGGIYSYATVRLSDGQIFAGQSEPSLEPVYYARTDDALHVSNHPLLAHMASTGGDRPRMDEHYYFSAVGGGVPIDESTPYLGCYRVPARSGLMGHRATAGMEIVATSPPAAPRHRSSTLRQRRVAMTEELERASALLHRLPVGELRVSGGKDSRMLAAYVANSGLEVVPINQNLPQEVEGQVADRVARVLGHPSTMRVPVGSTLSRTGIPEAVRRKIAYSGGLAHIAPMQYPTRVEGTRPGVPVIMGHAHLQRGGLNSRIRSVADAVQAVSARTVNPLILAPYAEPNLHRVRALVDRTLRESNNVAQAVGYHGYMAMPLNYQLVSLYTYSRNWNPLITPMVDERFAALCTAIAESVAPRAPWEHAGIIDLASERLAFGVIERLEPRLLEFPLAGARFKCDSPDSPGYQFRDPGLLVQGELRREDLAQIFNTRQMGKGLRAELWEQIEGTVVADFIRATVRPEIATFVSDPSSAAPEGPTMSQLSQIMWAMLGYATILGTDWWQVLAADAAP